MCGFSIILLLKRIMTIFKTKSQRILLNKNINFNKSETESKMENPTHVLERQTLCFSSYKNRKLKVKLWRVGKRGHFFVSLVLSEGIFLTFVFYFNVYCTEYTLRIYILFYLSKNITSYTFLLVLIIVESLQCILKTNRMVSTKWTFNKELSFASNYFIFLKILFQFKGALSDLR